jgi:AcrR family transcriptional regulator
MVNFLDRLLEMNGTRLTPRGERRRQHLMDVALSLFADKGYHATSVADIVRQERVGKGVFYWYFSSKEELFCEILRRGMAELRHVQGSAIAGAFDPLERIARGVRASLRYYISNPCLFALFEMAASTDLFIPLIHRGQETIVADTVRHIKDGIVEGTIRDADPHMLAHCMVGVTTHLIRAYFRGDLDPEKADHVVEAGVAFCLEGVQAP